MKYFVRIFFTLCVFFSLVSCDNKDDAALIVGSWLSMDVNNQLYVNGELVNDTSIIYKSELPVSGRVKILVSEYETDRGVDYYKATLYVYDSVSSMWNTVDMIDFIFSIDDSNKILFKPEPFMAAEGEIVHISDRNLIADVNVDYDFSSIPNLNFINGSGEAWEDMLDEVKSISDHISGTFIRVLE